MVANSIVIHARDAQEAARSGRTYFGLPTTAQVIDVLIDLASALLAVVFSLAIASASSRAGEPQLEFTPHNGFNGHSQGDGTLRLLMGKQRHFHVESHGYDQPDGTFRLDQTVTFDGKPSQERFWIIKTIRQDHYTAILSDASGPVSGFSEGSRLLLEYPVKGPLIMHQTLELMPDGMTIDNVGKITLLGIPVGRLHETIVRQDQKARP